MWLVLRSIPQMMVMAVIVTTMLFLPVGAALAVMSFAVLGVSLRAFVTFGGSLTAFGGLLAWWALIFVPVTVYTAYVMPWSGRE